MIYSYENNGCGCMTLQRIARLRREAGLTQEELARRADVSQSLVAKVETGRTEPTYSKAEQILAVLREERPEHENVESYMHDGVIAVSRSTPVREAVSLMQEHAISQLPVMEGGPVGLVTESAVLCASTGEGVNVEDVMEEAPPVVSASTPVEAVRGLLVHVPLVMVRDGDAVVGVVSKADLLRAGL